MSSNEQTAERSTSMWALLIGIDSYKTQNPLRGCVNDVEAVRTLLINNYNVSEEQIRVLTNEEATRANILKTFQEFLIGNPDIRRGDQILFHYSGHGSHMPARPEDYEPDGLDKTIVPHDSRTEEVYDISDKTLAALLDSLAATKGDQITVILDSCHSGSATRRVEDPAAVGVRRVPADERIPSADLDSDLHARVGTASRAAGPSGWAMGDIPYVLLAGCRDREEAYEYQATDDEQGGVWHGALTYFALQVLRRLPEGASYAELHEQVAALVHSIYASQTPQCEGRRDRQIFSGARVQHDPFVPVQEVEGNVVTLGAGLVHGLRPGTLLALYGSEARTRADLPPDPLATVEVVSVGAATAQAEINDMPAEPILEHARGLIIRQVYAGLRQTVALEAAEGEENSKAIMRLRRAIEIQPSSPYLLVVDGPEQAADLHVAAAEGKLSIYNADGELLVGPEDIGERGRDNAVLALHALESIVRYRAVLDLSNPDPGSQLEGKVKLRLRRYVEEPGDPKAEDLPSEAIGPDGEINLYYDPDHEERNWYVVDVINESELDVYPHVFTLSADYSINLLYPTLGQQEALRPNSASNPFSIGLQGGTTTLVFYLPPGWEDSQDYVKAIVTTEPIDLMALEQAGLSALPSEVTKSSRFVTPSPDPYTGALYRSSDRLEALIAATAAERPRTRSVRPSVRSDEWTTAHLFVRLQTQRFSEQQVIALNEEVIQLYEWGQYEQARVVAHQAYDLARGQLGEYHPTSGDGARNLGIVYLALGEYEPAEQFFREALETRRSMLGEADPAVATNLNDLAGLYWEMGRYAEAEPLARQALEILRTAFGEDNPEIATSLSNLAWLYMARGDYAEAESLARRALEIQRAALGEYHHETATMMSRLAGLYQEMGRYAEAEPLYQQANEILRRALGEEHPLFAQSLDGLAELHREMGDYQTAEQLYRQALEIQHVALGEEHPLLVENLNALADLCREQGKDNEAEPLYQQTLTIQREAGNRMGEATALKSLGAIYTRLGRYLDALAVYEQARTIHREAGDQVGEGAILRDMGAVHAGQGDYARARDSYSRALQLQRAVPDAPDLELAATRSSLAGALRERGDYENAERLYRQALDKYRPVLGDDHPVVAQNLYDLAAVLAATDQAFEAMGAAKKAAQSDAGLLELLPFVASESQRSAYLRTIQDNLDVFLSLVIKDFADSPALLRDSLDLVLRRKMLRAEALADQREAVLSARYPLLEPKLRELAALHRQIAYKVLARSDSDDRRTEQEVLDSWYGRKAELQAELAYQIAEFALAQQLRAVDRQAVARALPEGAVLAEFVRFRVYDFQAAPAKGEPCWQPACYLVFLLPAGEPDNVRMIDLGEAEPIDQMTAEFREMIARGSPSRGRRIRKAEAPTRSRTGREDNDSTIRARIFDPLLGSLGERRHLVLAPDGDLIQLPFEVLPTDDGRYLIDTYHFSYLNAGRDALRFAAAPAGQPAEPLVVADPDFDLGATETTHWLQPRDPEEHLPRFDAAPFGIRDEGRRVAKMLRVRPWLGEQALEAALKAFRAPRILHLAAPGFFLTDPDQRGTQVVVHPEGMDNTVWRMVEGDNPLLRAGLALCGANTWLQGGDLPPEAGNGLLTAEDISGLDLAGTELVVLSSSQSSWGEIRNSESVAALRRAIVLAGARSLVMDLWPVSDEQTSGLMQDFYKRVLGGQTHAAALRESQLAMKANPEYSDPLYWGAFVCQGDLSPLPVQSHVFVKADNPYQVGLPARGEAFVGRRDVLAMIQDNLAPTAGQNILVLRGQRRSGKTSVLYRLRDTLGQEEGDTFLPVLVDMQGMATVSGESEFFYRMARAIWKDLKVQGVTVSKPRLTDFEKAPVIQFEYEFLDEVANALRQDQRVLLMIDEFDKIKELIEGGPLRSEVLEVYRHLMQYTPLLFLIAGTQKLREFTGGYWSVLFNVGVPIDIGTMSESDTRWLITEPVRAWYKLHAPATDEIVRVAGCHPFFTAVICKKLLEIRNKSRVNSMTLDHVREAVDQALQSDDDQIGYPWTDKDCSLEERLVLSVMAREGGSDTPVPISKIEQRLSEANLTVDVGAATERLLKRDVLRREPEDEFAFVVPLLALWIIRREYDVLANALQYRDLT